MVNSKYIVTKEQRSTAQKVLEHLYMEGSINTKEALFNYGVINLHRVIKSLKRQGYLFAQTWPEKGVSKFSLIGVV